jgi:hypothetical protein
MKKISLILSIILMVFVSISCDKDEKTSYPVNISMTDAPGPYEAVNIDLKEVKVTGNDGIEVILNVNAGVYNLIDFSDGAEALIATGELGIDSLQQIRLILGPDNTIVVNGETFPLSTPSAEQSGLKLQVHEKLEAGVDYNILLDFDANKSIVKLGNGGYKLKPVIRTIDTALSGAIKGSVTPIGTLASVTAEYDGETYSSNVAEDGRFLIMGLPAGTYLLTIIPELPLNPVTKEDIVVEIGVSTDIGTIILE